VTSNLSEWHIPLSDLRYGPEEEAAVLRVLRSGWLSMGPEVEAFEQEFGKLHGATQAIAVSSGTAALHLAYLALDLGPRDEVIQPAINFVAAANMTTAVGATPVFADIVALNEPTIDADDIERRITARTKAVVVMHYGGYLCRMEEISALCKRHNLALIEDACHAVGTRYIGSTEESSSPKMAGTIGDIGCFSFFSNKNLSTGEGGMVVTKRSDLAERVRRLRSHGMTSLTWDRYKGHTSSYDVVANGFNYRLDEIHAALGRVQLQKLKSNNGKRNELVAAYRRLLGTLSNWMLPFNDYTGESSAHLMVAIAPDEQTRTRAADVLRNARIQTSMHYPFIPSFTAFRRDNASNQSPGLDKSASFAQRALTLPLFPGLEIQQVEEVCSLLSIQLSAAKA
jgi:dTDP-4-amino-4,6-dideoxygalactose transaminase